MFDIGFLELIFICVISLLVLGPERLPHAMKMLGRAVGKVKRAMGAMSQEINTQLELDELKESVQEQKDQLDISGDVQEVKRVVDQATNDINQFAANHSHGAGPDSDLPLRKAVNESF